MKKLLHIFFFFPGILYAQFSDDFSDGDFTNNPAWRGDTAQFTVVNISGNNVLRSNSTIASSNFYLATPAIWATNCQWEFWVNLAFNTSSANYVDVYLMSDSANLRAPGNSGYYVKIGNTTDEISLYKKVAGVSTEIIDGTDLVTNVSNSVLKIRVTRDSLHLWSLERDVTGTGASYVTEGTVTDSDILSTGFFGIHITQSTASFFQKHYFDDFYAGPIVGDTIPPALNAVHVVSGIMLDLFFSEAVEKASSENIVNYSVSHGIGNPAMAARDAADSGIVHLSFSNPFQNGVIHTLTVSNIRDRSGNVLTSASKDFLFFIPETPGYRDVIINEIFADPDPPVGLPNAEFVELFNRSNKVFDLDGWKFSDAGATVTLTSRVLLPGDYLILCSTANAGLFSAYGNTLGAGTLPSLNNSGDDLLLRSNSGLLIDRVTYSDTWYRDDIRKNGGWSLERIDSDFPCESSDNWAASADVSGGTPGRLNSVVGTVSDSVPPRVSSLEILSDNALRVTFSEPLDSLTALASAGYIVDNGIGIPVTVSVQEQAVTLFFTAFFDTNVVYRLTVSGVSDCIGNSIVSETVTFAIPLPADRFDVLITEIFADPDPQIALPAAEFVELYNVSSKVISLKDWSFSDASSSVMLPAYLLLPSDYLILCAGVHASNFLPYGKVLGLSSLPSLNNDGDELTLRTGSGRVVFYVSYTDAWYRDVIKKGGGWSLEMIDPDNPCTGADNWRASDDARGGTPGRVNSVNGINRDEAAPEVVSVLVTDSQHILVFFDEPLDSLSATDIANYAIDKGMAVVQAAFTGPAANEVLLALSPSLQRQTVYMLTVREVADCSGNPAGMDNTAQFGMPEIPAGFDLAINEILSNPVTGGSDFIELYNRSQKIIDLKDVILASIDEDSGDTSATVISARGIQLLPGNYVALTASPQSITSQYYTPNPKLVIGVASMPSYDDDEDIVVIFNRLDNNSVIDAVHYYSDWHFALLDDKNGVSLERINYHAASQDRNNWHSAASTVGYATPAYRNSQFGEFFSAPSAITIEPKAFSPDNDGYQDVLNIRYKLEQPGYVAHIDIYDDDGRKIRGLVSNWLLDIEGNIIWDGVKDDGEKARIGVYIVIAELFDLFGNKKKFKESCVLAGRF